MNSDYKLNQMYNELDDKLKFKQYTMIFLLYLLFIALISD